MTTVEPGLRGLQGAVVLDVPFADVDRAGLRWALDLPERAALVHRLVHVGRVAVDLRVLGASHQVVVHPPTGADFSETVACDLLGAGPLEDAVTRPGYRLSSRTTRPADLAAAVDAVLARLSADPASVSGRFPGSDHAVTALRVCEGASGRVLWETWHAYPQSGELVHTASELDPTVHAG